MAWSNWAGNQAAEPTSVCTPRDVDELAGIVKRAADDGRRVKAIGSGHSFTAIGVTDGVQVNLSQMAGFVAADRRTKLVTVQAGMPLHRLNAALAEVGLALSNLGDVDAQTISGALSTGTHGTGRRLGGLATQIRAMELVLADGSVVTTSATERPQLFQAARVSLGALGVASTITLQAEDAFALHAQEQPMALPDVLAGLDELVQGNDHFEFYWFPHTERALTKRNNRLPTGQPSRPLSRARAILDDEILSNGLFGLTCRLGKTAPGLVPRINNIAGQLLGAREYSDASHKVFVSPRRVRFVEMEYAVPAAALPEALKGVQRVIERENLRVSFPIEVRFAAADDIPLSTASGRESAYIAVHMFRGQPFERYFRGVESVMNELDGRPHWGKMHYQDAEVLRSRYPRFDEFRAVRDSVDPDRRFANDYLERVLG